MQEKTGGGKQMRRADLNGRCTKHRQCRVLSILTLTSPFFALVACSYLSARLRWLALSAIPRLNSFFLPCRVCCTYSVLRHQLRSYWTPAWRH